MHAYNPSTCEVEAGGLLLTLGYPQLQSESLVVLDLREVLSQRKINQANKKPKGNPNRLSDAYWGK